MKNRVSFIFSAIIVSVAGLVSAAQITQSKSFDKIDSILMSKTQLSTNQEPEGNQTDEDIFVKNIYGQRISWKGHLPIIFQLDSSVPTVMKDSIQKAMDTWNQSIGKELFKLSDKIHIKKIEEIETSRQSTKDSANIIYWITKGTWMGGEDEQARTNAFWQGSEIKEADILINAKNFQFFSEIPQNENQIDLDSVILHELGHVLGLKHQDFKSSIMASYLKPLEKRRVLMAFDLSSIQKEYGKTSSDE